MYGGNTISSSYDGLKLTSIDYAIAHLNSYRVAQEAGKREKQWLRSAMFYIKKEMENG